MATHGGELAMAYLRDVEAAMNHLLNYPELGTETGLRPLLRAFSVREHRILYRAEGKAIVVARVLHKSMDVKRHL